MTHGAESECPEAPRQLDPLTTSLTLSAPDERTKGAENSADHRSPEASPGLRVESFVVPSMTDVGMIASSSTLERVHHEMIHQEAGDIPGDGEKVVCDGHESPTAREEFFRHWGILLCYFLAYSSMGMAIALAGPTLIVLARQIREPKMSNMSFSFMGRAAGFMSGSIFAGRLYDRCGRRFGQIYMACCLFVTAILTFTFSVVPSLALLILNCYVLAFSMGAVDNIVQMLLIALIKSEVEPFLQALHSGFAFGCFISPLVVSIFVSDVGTEGSSDATIDIDVDQGTRYKWAFYVIAMLILIPATSLLILSIRGIGPFKEDKKVSSQDESQGTKPLKSSQEALPEFVQTSENEEGNASREKPHEAKELGLGRPLDVSNDGLDDAFGMSDSPFNSNCARRYLESIERLDHDLVTPRPGGGPSEANLAVDLGEETEDAQLTTRRNQASEIEMTVVRTHSQDQQSVGASTNSQEGGDVPGTALYSSSTSVPITDSKELHFKGDRRVIIVTAGFILFFYVGAETGFGSYLPVYAYKKGLLAESKSSLLNSVFWFAFFLGRVLGVPMSRRYTPQQLIRGDILVAVVSLTILIVFNKSIAVLWVTSCLFGLAAASLYASVIALVERTIALNGTVMGVLVFMTCSGEALFPFFMGLAFDLPAGPLSMMLITVSMMVCCGGLYYFIATYREKHVSPEKLKAEREEKRRNKS